MEVNDSKSTAHHALQLFNYLEKHRKIMTKYLYYKIRFCLFSFLDPAVNLSVLQTSTFREFWPHSTSDTQTWACQCFLQ